ncbi:MAG TPA: hypothetical protein VFP21_08445 [Solirubrobacterales bacterium]|nr:hypothetical protein [Solirubrobacterales bacterium]
MRNKFILTCAAVAAFAAFVVAPAASAGPVLTDSLGKSVAVGTEITGKNVNNVSFTGGFAVTCNSVDLTGKITENIGNSIKWEVLIGGATFGGTGANGDCTTSFGAASVTANSRLCFAASGKTDVVEITGCATNPVTFTINVTGMMPCKYNTAKVLGSHTTAPMDAEMTFIEQEAKLEEGPAFCPVSGKIDIVLALTTKTGGTLAIS